MTHEEGSPDWPDDYLYILKHARPEDVDSVVSYVLAGGIHSAQNYCEQPLGDMSRLERVETLRQSLEKLCDEIDLLKDPELSELITDHMRQMADRIINGGSLNQTDDIRVSRALATYDISNSEFQEAFEARFKERDALDMALSEILGSTVLGSTQRGKKLTSGSGKQSTLKHELVFNNTQELITYIEQRAAHTRERISTIAATIKGELQTEAENAKRLLDKNYKFQVYVRESEQLAGTDGLENGLEYLRNQLPFSFGKVAFDFYGPAALEEAEDMIGDVRQETAESEINARIDRALKLIAKCTSPAAHKKMWMALDPSLLECAVPSIELTKKEKNFSLTPEAIKRAKLIINHRSSSAEAGKEMLGVVDLIVLNQVRVLASLGRGQEAKKVINEASDEIKQALHIFLPDSLPPATKSE